MDREKIEQIRKELSIPLTYALKLLKDNQNDVSAAIINFHTDNIEKVIQATECKMSVAQDAYQYCNFDVQKAIIEIKSQVMLITTRDNQQKIKNEIGFILWAETEGSKTSSNDIFIPAHDFDYILDAFKVACNNTLSKNNFDVCGYNYLDHHTCNVILNAMLKIPANNLAVEKFLIALISWWSDQLKRAKYIVVYGNL
ncbi:hypothetical protein [Acinetobacter sp. YK3]|uniref:hypothetical protein n=1 Tax=Acinetobacter sp. YK3 TaxID=1860097 RepID=UPI00084C041B|nr:hypothetical protein [Acinetobacter sp. YK3]OEC88996.1 hypothetical protein A9Z07_08110 [Acinetobacter sp. YK3]